MTSEYYKRILIIDRHEMTDADYTNTLEHFVNLIKKNNMIYALNKIGNRIHFKIMNKEYISQEMSEIDIDFHFQIIKDHIEWKKCNCGNENDMDAKFCNECGMKLL